MWPLSLLTLAASIAGVVLLSRGLQGYARLSEPKCAKCGYDLRGFGQDVPTRCSECGTDLRNNHAVRWGDYQPNRPFIVTGALLVALPLLPLLMQFASGTAVMPLPPMPIRASAQSNSEIIADLAKNAGSPWGWDELASRYRTGKLSSQEVEEAIDQLIQHLQRQPSQGVTIIWEQDFLEAVDAAGAIPQDQYDRMVEVFHQDPEVSVASKATENRPLRFSVRRSSYSELPGTEAVMALREVRLEDGRALRLGETIPSRYLKRRPSRDVLSTRDHFIDGRVLVDAEPGEHQMTFVVDLGVLPEGSTPNVIDDRPGQARHWPKSRSRSVREITIPITVVKKGEPTVELVTDPASDPTSLLSIRSAKVTRDGKGSRIELEFKYTDDPQAIALSFDAVFALAGQEHQLMCVSVPAETFGSSLIIETPFDPQVRMLDLVLRPNAAHARHFSGIDRIWGKPIVIKKVQLTRYDLPEGSDE